MTQNFNITRDNKGIPSFGINTVFARKLNNSFAIGDESYILLEDIDYYCIFLPQFGGSYHIGPNTIPAIPSNPGAQIVEVDAVMSPSSIDLVNWPFSIAAPTEKRLYIKSLVAQEMTILIYSRGE